MVYILEKFLFNNLPRLLKKHFLFYLFFLLLVNFIFYWKFEIFRKEIGLVEFSQLFFIINSIGLTIYYKNLLKKIYSDFIYKLRVIFFIFIFYEEISFLTANLFENSKTFSTQAEINIHNYFLLSSDFFNIPFMGEGVSLISILVIIILFFMSYGNRFCHQQKNNIFFLDFEYSFIFILWTINLFLSLILRMISFKSPLFINGFIIEPEIMELLFYSILYLDSYSKILRFRIR